MLFLGRRKTDAVITEWISDTVRITILNLALPLSDLEH